MGRRQDGFCRSIPAAGCNCKANEASGLLSTQPGGLKPFVDFCGVARSDKTAAGIAKRLRLQKLGNGFQRYSWDLFSVSLEELKPTHLAIVAGNQGNKKPETLMRQTCDMTTIEDWFFL